MEVNDSKWQKVKALSRRATLQLMLLRNDRSADHNSKVMPQNNKAKQ